MPAVTRSLMSEDWEWNKARLTIGLGPFSAFFEPEGGNGMGGETGSQKRLGRG